jgi:PilZ domain
MTSKQVVRESRRSTRVGLKVAIEAHGLSEPVTCEGETIVVNLHGALILTAVTLRVGMKISIHVHLTDKRATAEVVYVDPDQPRHCGIKLEKPQNIWGLSFPPDDWHEE